MGDEMSEAIRKAAGRLPAERKQQVYRLTSEEIERVQEILDRIPGCTVQEAVRLVKGGRAEQAAQGDEGARAFKQRLRVREASDD